MTTFRTEWEADTEAMRIIADYEAGKIEQSEVHIEFRKLIQNCVPRAKRYIRREYSTFLIPV